VQIKQIKGSLRKLKIKNLKQAFLKLFDCSFLGTMKTDLR
jgi:hypothetical protein